MYNGRTDPNEHLIKFSITMAQARSSLEECDMGYCQFFVEHLERAALSLILAFKSKLDMLHDASCHLKYGSVTPLYNFVLLRRVRSG